MFSAIKKRRKKKKKLETVLENQLKIILHSSIFQNTASETIALNDMGLITHPNKWPILKCTDVIFNSYFTSDFFFGVNVIKSFLFCLRLAAAAHFHLWKLLTSSHPVTQFKK